MADNPDPTRRLRPLQEARALRAPRAPRDQRPVSGDAPFDGHEPVADEQRVDPEPVSTPRADPRGWVPTWPVPTPVDPPAPATGTPPARAPGRHRGPDAVDRDRRVSGDGDDGRVADLHRDDDPDVPDRYDAFDLDGDRGGHGDDESGRRLGLLGGRLPWARWRERWVPEGPGVRIDPGRRGSALLSVIAIGAVVAAALGLFGTGGTVVGPSTVAVVEGQTSAVSAEPVSAVLGAPAVSVSADAAGSVAAAVTGSTPPGEIIVAVTGAVTRPGIVTLTPGSRVADAIAAAGGVVDGTDYTGLNLAAKLADGDSVVVGGTGQGIRSSGTSAAAPGSTTSTGGPGDLVDLNAADQATLETLPGVGPVMAGNILAWRETNGGFTAVDQLQEITGIGPARFGTLAPLVRVG